MRLQEILRRLAEIRDEIQTRGHELTDEDLNTLEAEIRSLQEERDTIISAEQRRQNILNDISLGAGTTIRSFNNEVTEETDPYSTMEYRKAFMNYVLRRNPLPAEYRAAGPAKTGDIGAVIPTPVMETIIQKLETSGNILALITRTAYPGGVTIPKNNVKPTATWVAEGESGERQKGYANGDISFNYYKLKSTVSVTLETQTMAIPTFEAMIVNNLVEALIIALEKAIIAGTGTGQPKGIIKETAPEGQTINTAKPSYKDLVDCEAALPQAYENGAYWCMSKKTYMAYYGLTDDSGQPIGRINYGNTTGPEYMLLGRTVQVCDHMPNIASAENNSVIGFIFRFKDYILNSNLETTVKSFEDDDTDDQVTKAITLADGKVVDNNSLVLLTKVASV